MSTSPAATSKGGNPGVAKSSSSSSSISAKSSATKSGTCAMGPETRSSPAWSGLRRVEAMATRTDSRPFSSRSRIPRTWRPSSFRLKGRVRNASTPRRAWSRAPRSARSYTALISTAGTSAPPGSSRSRSRTEKPWLSGSIKSSSTRSAGCSAKRSRPFAPVVAVSTSNPLNSRSELS